MPDPVKRPTHTRGKTLTQLTVDEMSRVAVAFEKSGTFQVPKPGGGGTRALTSAELFVIILAGQELGLGPSQSVMGIKMIKGKPEFSANLMAAMVRSNGNYDFRTTFGTDEDPWCEVAFFDANGNMIGVSRFSKQDAITANLWSNNYLKFWRNMLFARALSNGVKWFVPDALMVSAYHEGETDGDTEAPPPELPQAVTPSQVTTGSNATTTMQISAPEPAASDGEKVPVAPNGEPYDRPEEVIDREDVEVQEVGFDVTSDPGPSEPFEPTEDVPFDYDPVTPVEAPPTVKVADNERTATPGQIGLLHVLAAKANLSEEDYRNALFQSTGQRHADKVPFAKVNDAIAALKALDLTLTPDPPEDA